MLLCGFLIHQKKQIQIYLTARMQTESQNINIAVLALLVLHEVIRQKNTKQNLQYFPSHAVNTKTLIQT